MTAKIEHSELYKKPIDLRSERVVLYPIATPIKYKPLIEELIEDKDKLSLFEKLWMLVKTSPVLVKLIINIVKLFRVKEMEDIKTTILGIITGVLVLLTTIGVTIAPELQNTILQIAGYVLSIIVAIWGWLQKDKVKK